jgi:hypothetical protein
MLTPRQKSLMSSLARNWLQRLVDAANAIALLFCDPNTAEFASSD